MTTDKSPPERDEPAAQNDALDVNDVASDEGSRIQELETTQTSLLGLMLQLVQDKADSVGKDEYLRQLEEGLEGVQKAQMESQQTIRQLRVRLAEAERENGELVLAVKMYKLDVEAETSQLDDHEPSSLPQLPELPHNRKRGFGETHYVHLGPSYDVANAYRTDDKDESIPSTVKSAKQHLAVCIPCFDNDRRCDSGEPCQSCLKNRVKCQRAMCAKYKAGTCSVPTCTRVHEDDIHKYKRVIRAGHVKKKNTGGTFKADDGGDDDDAKPGGGGVGVLAEGL